MLLHWVIITPYFFLQWNISHFRQEQVMILKGLMQHNVFNFILCFMHLTTTPFLEHDLHPQWTFPPIQEILQAKYFPILWFLTPWLTVQTSKHYSDCITSPVHMTHICLLESPSWVSATYISQVLRLVQFNHSVLSNSLWPHGLQHTRLPCPSPTPRACSNSPTSNQWCHPTISSSVVPFSSCIQSFPASWSFPVSCLHTLAKVLELQLQHQSLQWKFRTDFL